MKKLIMKPRTFSLQNGSEIVIVNLSGYFDTTDAVKNVFVHIFQRNVNLILDFREVTGVFIDLFHSFIFRITEMAREAGGDIALVGLEDKHKVVFAMLGMENLIVMHDNIKDAIHWFESKFQRIPKEDV